MKPSDFLPIPTIKYTIVLNDIMVMSYIKGANTPNRGCIMINMW